MEHSGFARLDGSERRALPGAALVREADPTDTIGVSVYVRPDPRFASRRPTLEDYRGLAVSRAFDDTPFRADQADIDAVSAYYRGRGLTIDEADARKRSIRMHGTVAQCTAAFRTNLHVYRDERQGEFRGRTGHIMIPDELAPLVQGVFGLDDRRIGRAQIRRAPRTIAHANAKAVSYEPPQVAALYDFPPNTDGTGRTIGIITFNGEIASGSGGYDAADVAAYYRSVVGSTGPTIANVTILGPGNDPGDGTNPADSSDEVLLDLAVVGTLAPAAAITMYFTLFTEQGWVDAITSAVTDANAPHVISISYGNPEDEYGSGYAWTAAGITMVDDAFQRAAALNISICVASGDSGSTDGVTDGKQHCDFPASSPWVLACGGTSLHAKGTAIASEVVWNDGTNGGATGGGVSEIFPLPSYQANAKVPPSANPDSRVGRGVPDVASNADPETGYTVPLPGGGTGVVGGTSAAAPLWAALLARVGESLGTTPGFVTPLLYGDAATGVLRDVTSGNNGAYKAGPGWDACTGLGSPNGTALTAALKPPAA
jgi:kumamolisin